MTSSPSGRMPTPTSPSSKRSALNTRSYSLRVFSYCAKSRVLRCADRLHWADCRHSEASTCPYSRLGLWPSALRVAISGDCSCLVAQCLGIRRRTWPAALGRIKPKPWIWSGWQRGYRYLPISLRHLALTVSSFLVVHPHRLAIALPWFFSIGACNLRICSRMVAR